MTHFVAMNDAVYHCEAPRPQGGASRQGIIIYIVPLDPAGHIPATNK